jgi:hypothetical protein
MLSPDVLRKILQLCLNAVGTSYKDALQLLTDLALHFSFEGFHANLLHLASIMFIFTSDP